MPLTNATEPVYTRSELETFFLPVREMLQIDRVLSIENDRITCQMDLSNHWVFPLHFPSDPIFPGTLLIEAAGQAIAIWAWHAGTRGRPRLVRVKGEFEHPVLPDQGAVILSATVRQRKNVFLGNVEILVSGRKVAEVKPVVVVIPR